MRHDLKDSKKLLYLNFAPQYSFILQRNIEVLFSPFFFGILVVVFLVTSVTGNGLLIETTSVQAAAGQETEPISKKITQSRDQIENDLKK
jgi:hypothetical protein